MVNPLNLMKFNQMKKTIEKNHPRLFPFLKAVSENAVKEGSIIEINVTCPDGKTYRTNLKLSASDIEVLKKAKAQTPH